ncbi:MAG: glycosyltransferase involved in cell wall biosynthesis [Celeribacter sp.]
MPQVNLASNTAKKITFITRKWPPAIGGMETYSKRLHDGLQRDFDVTLLACEGQADGSPPRVPKLLGFGLKSFWQLFQTRTPPDVVHIGDMASWPLALGVKFKRWPSQIVISAHGTDVSYPRRGGLKGKLYGAYLHLGHRVFSRGIVIANSQATADAARDFGWTRVEIVPLASDLRGPNIQPKTTTSLLFAGRILPLKGLSWFVENVLPNLPNNITLRVAGTIWDDTEAKCLDHPRVTYLGPLEQSKLTAEYANALAVIIPNIPVENGTFEGFGLVATEASACGAVTLAAASGGLCDAVIDGTTGFLLPPMDVCAWGDKINQISNWSTLDRQNFVTQSMQACHAHYSWDRVVGETVNIYDL